MLIRRTFTTYLAVQSEAAPASRQPGAAEAACDYVLDWRWFEEEAAVVTAAIAGQQAAIGRR